MCFDLLKDLNKECDKLEILEKVKYQANRAVLHTDKKMLPKNPKVWSAWNYLSAKQQSGERPV